MKFYIVTKKQKRQNEVEKYSQWHKKFAWLPVRSDGDKTAVIWLEFVLRKGTVRAYSVNKLHWDWTYAESSFDILKGSV